MQRQRPGQHRVQHGDAHEGEEGDAEAASIRAARAATAETDRARQAQLWIEFQEQMVEQANLVILFQPIYQVAVRDSVGRFPLTAAGWLAEVSGAKP